jgi:hypothetical protein
MNNIEKIKYPWARSSIKKLKSEKTISFGKKYAITFKKLENETKEISINKKKIKYKDIADLIIQFIWKITNNQTLALEAYVQFYKCEDENLKEIINNIYKMMHEIIFSSSNKKPKTPEYPLEYALEKLNYDHKANLIYVNIREFGYLNTIYENEHIAEKVISLLNYITFQLLKINFMSNKSSLSYTISPETQTNNK